MGVSTAVIAQQQAQPASTQYSPDFEVFVGNAATVQWYLDHPFIWRDGFNGRMGMDYTQIDAALKLERHPPAQRADLFKRLRAIEDGYMTELMRKA